MFDRRNKLEPSPGLKLYKPSLETEQQSTNTRGRRPLEMIVGNPFDTTDEELIQRYKAGDREAFGELVARHSPAIYNLIYRFTGNSTEAENLTQETWLRFWSALPRISLDRPVKPYLLKIAFNLCRSWAAKTRAPLLDLDADEAQDWLTEDGEDLVERLTETELQERLASAVDQLPPLYRTVITLRYTEDLSYEEIAQTLELPLNTVRTHLRRAKARLRRIMEQQWMLNDQLNIFG